MRNRLVPESAPGPRAHHHLLRPRAARGLIHFYNRRSHESSARPGATPSLPHIIFWVGALLGEIVSVVDCQGFQRFMLGGEMAEHHRAPRDVETLHSHHQTARLQRDLRNNLSVAFAACAMGITAGLGTTGL